MQPSEQVTHNGELRCPRVRRPRGGQRTRLPDTLAIIRRTQELRAARGLKCSVSGKVVRQPTLAPARERPELTVFVALPNDLRTRLVVAASLRAIRVVRLPFLTVERAAGRFLVAALALPACGCS